MRRVLLLVTFLLVMGAQLAVPAGAQWFTQGTAGFGVAAISGPLLYCNGMPYPC